MSAFRDVGILDHILNAMRRRGQDGDGDGDRDGDGDGTMRMYRGSFPRGGVSFLDSVREYEDRGLKDGHPPSSVSLNDAASGASGMAGPLASGGLGGGGDEKRSQELQFAESHWGNLGAVVIFVRSTFQVR